MLNRMIMARLARRQMSEQWINSPAGPKTIHFWAPAWKWSLVFAGLADYFRLVFNFRIISPFGYALK